MHSEWQQFLQQAGATLDQQRVAYFGDPDDELNSAVNNDIDIVCDLSQLGLIKVSGPDSENFLQGQLSNDVAAVTINHSQLSAYCNPKGRMLALLRLFRRPDNLSDNLYLITAHERIDAVLKRLRMFVLMAKTELMDASEELIGLGLSGPNAASILKTIVGQAPEHINEVLQNNEISVIRLPNAPNTPTNTIDPPPRFAIYTTVTHAPNLWQQLTQHAQAVGEHAWRLLDIRAGLPMIYNTTAEAFVPQMVNLQALDGINFKKGCYVGQEVVARAHYLGQLKRRMARITLATSELSVEELPQPGNPIYAPSLRGEQKVGEIVTACPNPDSGIDALAVIMTECIEQPQHALTWQQAAFTIATLPYSVAEKEQA